MSQDQLQIFHAAFQPRVKSPKDQKMRQVIKLINKEWENLEMFKERHERMKVASGEPKTMDAVSARYADKIASEAIES